MKEKFLHFPDLDWNIIKNKDYYDFNPLNKHFNNIFEAANDAIQQVKIDIKNNSVFIPKLGSIRLELSDSEKMLCELTGLRVRFITNCEMFASDEVWVTVYNSLIDHYNNIINILNKYDSYNLRDLWIKLENDIYKNNL